MHINDIFAQDETTFSFEFFPRVTAKLVATMLEHAAELVRLQPSFVSVTYGAGGTTRERTRDAVIRMRRELGVNATPHLTCVGSSRDELHDIVQEFKDHSISNILALRGDPPRGQRDFQPHPNGLHYANELVELIASFDHFGIGVAGYPEGHPETPNKLEDLANLKRKVDAGAHFIVTQLFFDNRDFYDFRDCCDLTGVNAPIIAGIMPILSKAGIERLAGLCGARIPAPLLRRLVEAGDNDEEVTKIGIDWATEQCLDLLANGVRGIHFYTLNQSTATMEIYHNLGVKDSNELRALASP